MEKNSQLFPCFVRNARNDYGTYKGRYDTVLKKAVVFQDTIATNTIFILEEERCSKNCLDTYYRRQI